MLRQRRQSSKTAPAPMARATSRSTEWHGERGCDCGAVNPTQVPSRGVGNGLETASGTATKKTRPPHNVPATRMAGRETRSVESDARSARMLTPMYAADDNDAPCASPPPKRSRSAALAMVVDRDYHRVNRPGGPGLLAGRHRGRSASQPNYPAGTGRDCGGAGG